MSEPSDHDPEPMNLPDPSPAGFPADRPVRIPAPPGGARLSRVLLELSIRRFRGWLGREIRPVFQGFHHLR
jgi:hypothetical protein